MNLLLPVDSRIANTQGFLILNTSNHNILDFGTNEDLDFARKGFRGACLVDRRIYVCNSFSVKIFLIKGTSISNISFVFEKQLQFPEWLIGRGANADLHMLYFDEQAKLLYLANSYMDSVDILSLDGELLERKYLWDLNKSIRNMVKDRNPEVADLCHLNHITKIGDEIVLTLGNINGSGKGALLNFNNGEFIINDLNRPHDGILHKKQFFITETSKNRVLVYNDINGIKDFKYSRKQYIDLSPELVNDENNKFFARGLLVTDDNIFVGCSQFQDRNIKSPTTVASHIIVIDRKTFSLYDKLWVPSIGQLERPVLYSILDFDTIFE